MSVFVFGTVPVSGSTTLSVSVYVCLAVSTCMCLCIAISVFGSITPNLSVSVFVSLSVSLIPSVPVSLSVPTCLSLFVFLYIHVNGSFCLCLSVSFSTRHNLVSALICFTVFLLSIKLVHFYILSPFLCQPLFNFLSLLFPFCPNGPPTLSYHCSSATLFYLLYFYSIHLFFLHYSNPSCVHMLARCFPPATVSLTMALSLPNYLCFSLNLSFNIPAPLPSNPLHGTSPYSLLLPPILLPSLLLPTPLLLPSPSYPPPVYYPPTLLRLSS